MEQSPFRGQPMTWTLIIIVVGLSAWEAVTAPAVHHLHFRDGVNCKQAAIETTKLSDRDVKIKAYCARTHLEASQ